MRKFEKSFTRPEPISEAAIEAAVEALDRVLAAMPGFALFLPPAQAVVLSASLALALGVQTFPQYRGKTPYKNYEVKM